VLHCLSELSWNTASLNAKSTDHSRLGRIFLNVLDVIVLRRSHVLAGIGCIVVDSSTDLFYRRELHLQQESSKFKRLTLSSSEEKVLLELRPSPDIISFSSGNFLVFGNTFFLSTRLFVFFWKLLFWKLWSPASLTLSELRLEY
jgi:hypothetical protein